MKWIFTHRIQLHYIEQYNNKLSYFNKETKILKVTFIPLPMIKCDKNILAFLKIANFQI